MYYTKHYKRFQNNDVINYEPSYYDLDFVLSKRYTFILSNTRELNRVPTTN